MKRSGGVGEKPQRCAPDRKSGRRRGGGRKLREEGNSHQPDSESYAEEKPEQDTTQPEGRGGRGPRESERGENNPKSLVSLQRENFPWNDGNFFLRAQSLGQRRAAGVRGSAPVTHARDPKGVLADGRVLRHPSSSVERSLSFLWVARSFWSSRHSSILTWTYDPRPCSPPAH